MSWNLQDVYRSDEEFRTKNQLGKPRRAEFQRLHEDAAVAIRKVRVSREETNPPEFLQEHELVGLMDKHGIGTDASMASHVSTIVDRNYVVVCDKEGTHVPDRREFKPREWKWLSLVLIFTLYVQGFRFRSE